MSENKDIRELMHHGNYEHSLDIRGIPMRQCVCGCEIFLGLIAFDENNEIAFYFLDGECVSCVSLVPPPPPLDNKED